MVLLPRGLISEPLLYGESLCWSVGIIIGEEGA